MDPVAPLRMSRVLPTPLPYAGSAIWGYVHVGLRMRDTTPLLFASVRESLVCLVLLTREALAPIHSWGMSNDPPPSFACFEQRMTVPNFWRSAVVWSVACAERRATKAYAERLRIVMGRNAIERGFDSQEFGGGVWSLALIKIFNLSRCAEWPIEVSEISE